MVIPCRASGKPSVFDVLDKKEEPSRPSPPGGFADAGEGGHQASLLRKSLNCSDLANKRAVGANGRLPRSKYLALLGCRSRRKGTCANGSAGCRLKAAASPADGAQSIGWYEETTPKTSHPNRGLVGCTNQSPRPAQFELRARAERSCLFDLVFGDHLTQWDGLNLTSAVSH